MGYETTAVFVNSSSKKAVGYHSVEATLELGKVAYGKFAELLQSHTNKDEQLMAQVLEREAMQKKCFSVDGEYTAELNAMTKVQRDAVVEKLFVLGRKLAKVLPYAFIEDGNTECYTDRYGDLLIVVGLTELEDTIRFDNAKMIADGEYGVHGYRRFNMLLSLIKSFKDAFDGCEQIRVVLYGH